MDSEERCLIDRRTDGWDVNVRFVVMEKPYVVLRRLGVSDCVKFSFDCRRLVCVFPFRR